MGNVWPLPVRAAAALVQDRNDHQELQQRRVVQGPGGLAATGKHSCSKLCIQNPALLILLWLG